MLLPLLAALFGFTLARWSGEAPKPKLIAATPAPIAPATPSPEKAPAATPAPDATKPPDERLRSALHVKSPLESAARALAVIDAMTADDFKHLADKPGSFPTPSSHGFDQEFSDAYMNALIDRWFAVNPAGALAGIQQMEKKLIIKPGSVWSGSGEFFSALARTRPEVRLGTLPEKALWDNGDPSLATAFTALAKRDPASARGYLDRFADPEQRKSAEVAIAQGIAENDPPAAVALARTLDSAQVFESALAVARRRGAGAVRDVLIANAKKFPLAYNLPELALRDPDEDWAALTGDTPGDQHGVSMQTIAAAERLTPEERERCLASLDRLPPNLREQLTGTLLGAWAKDDPRPAAEWAVTHAKPEDSEAPESRRVEWPFHTWLRADEAAALAWCARLPASPLRDDLTNGAAAWLANAGNIAAAVSLLRPRDGEKSSYAIAAIAVARAKDDPAAAAAWIDSLPPDTDTGGAVGALVEKWAGREAAGAASWVEAQPAGPRREAALQAYTRAAAELDPAAAGEWAAAIADPKARTKAAEYIFRQWTSRDPTAARAWLRALPGVDPVLLDRIIRIPW